MSDLVHNINNNVNNNQTISDVFTVSLPLWSYAMTLWSPLSKILHTTYMPAKDTLTDIPDGLKSTEMLQIMIQSVQPCVIGIV